MLTFMAVYSNAVQLNITAGFYFNIFIYLFISYSDRTLRSGRKYKRRSMSRMKINNSALG